jgi:hypothetical protein
MNECIPNKETAEVTILGGGLAGMLAAIRLGDVGKRVILIDHSLPNAASKLGGFAKFSGAKFSYPPAGMGLLPLAGSDVALENVIEEVLDVLGISHYQRSASSDVEVDPLAINENLRSYKSIVLTPTQIDDLVERLTNRVLKNSTVIKGRLDTLTKFEGGWKVGLMPDDSENMFVISSKIVIYAAGRLASDVLRSAGATTRPGKGLDVGIRAEFLDKHGLTSLRAIGPDAKIIAGACRTFCLNSPGEIYYYEYNGVQIPGGVVACPEVPTANVGILYRTSEKEKLLDKIWTVYAGEPNSIRAFSKVVRTGMPEFRGTVVERLLGTQAARELEEFCISLSDARLVDWEFPHQLHVPLVDWFWDVFCQGTSHKTSLDGVYAVGDSAGHARGLLQAAVSGWLAAEEYLHDYFD